MTDTHQSPIGYGQQPKKRHRLRWVALFSLFALTVAFAILSPKLWGRYLYFSKVHSLQSRCLRYTAPPTRVVYDSDQGDRAKLLGSSGYRPFNDWAVFVTPTAWHDLRGSYACPDGTAFLHARTAATGPTRLVAVDLIPTGRDVVRLHWSVSNIASPLNSAAIEQSRKTTGQTTIKLDGHGKPIRIYAGQVDPTNDAKFTIKGAFGTKPFQVDGQLLADGKVALTQHPPAGVTAVAGVSCLPTGPSGPGFDPSTVGPSACYYSGKH